MMSGIDRIAVERQRQVVVEKWTAEHDDETHTDGALAMVAALYAAPDVLYAKNDYANEVHFVDPWPEGWGDKRPYADRGNVLLPNSELPADERIRQLEKAGALIAAEIDRLLRMETHAAKQD